GDWSSDVCSSDLGDRRDLRRGEPRAAMPPPQARERRRVLAGGAEGSGESGDARGLSAAGEGRDGAAGEAGAVAGTRISECRSQPARRPGRDVYGEPLGTVAELGALPGLD